MAMLLLEMVVVRSLKREEDDEFFQFYFTFNYAHLFNCSLRYTDPVEVFTVN